MAVDAVLHALARGYGSVMVSYNGERWNAHAMARFGLIGVFALRCEDLLDAVSEVYWQARDAGTIPSPIPFEGALRPRAQGEGVPPTSGAQQP